MSSTVVSINGYALEPAPLIAINKVYNKIGNNTPVSAYFNITVNFTLVSDMGSPRSKIDTSLSDTNWGGFNKQFWTGTGYATRETLTGDQHLASFLRKQEALRKVFESYLGEGHHLEVQSADGSYPLKAQVTLQDITFNEGVWWNTCQATITLRAAKLTIYGSAYDEDLFSAYPYSIESINEDWQFDTEETPESQTLPRIYKVSHNLNCKGINVYDSNSPPNLVSAAWIQAKQAVLNGVYVGGPLEAGGPDQEAVGITSSTSTNYLTANSFSALSGVRDLPSYYVMSNHLRTESINRGEGTYGITEAWILSSGRSLFDFTIEKTDDIKNPLTTVSINGTITGLDERNPINLSLITSKFQNADTRLSGEVGNFHAICQNYGGVSLNAIPITKTIGKNITNGTISVNYAFDNRQTNYLNGGSGVRNEQITVTYGHQGNRYAVIPILGRAAGDLIQNLSSYTAKTKTLNINANMEPSNSLNFTSPDISVILAAVTPTGTIVMSDPPEENISSQGEFSYTRRWVYE